MAGCGALASADPEDRPQKGSGCCRGWRGYLPGAAGPDGGARLLAPLVNAGASLVSCRRGRGAGLLHLHLRLATAGPGGAGLVRRGHCRVDRQRGLGHRARRGRGRRRRPPLTRLDSRLLTERDTIRSVLGRNWWRAVLLTTGRLGFDFCCLLAALRATGTDPRPSLVLLAYAAANVVALVPITPGGLGLVEASLGGLLILAGVHGGDAFLATLVYRPPSPLPPPLPGPPAHPPSPRPSPRPAPPPPPTP